MNINDDAAVSTALVAVGLEGETIWLVVVAIVVTTVASTCYIASSYLVIIYSTPLVLVLVSRLRALQYCT